MEENLMQGRATPETERLVNAPKGEVRRLKDLSPQQWRSGMAAWLGWLFDGLDMHLYTLVAAPFVMTLVAAQSASDPNVKTYSSYIQAAFLVGWALGGGFFGRLGDKIGRSRALSLTILTYAIFTGLSAVAQNWWQLMIFRFLAALGIGGEWAVGSSLLSETWPKKWRPWIAAVLQTGVNIGVLLACVTVYTMSFSKDYNPRYVFLVGILPALLVFWIRKNVPEPEEWHRAKLATKGEEPGLAELFKGKVLRTTILTIIVCASSLTAWWAFMFWNPQHMRNLATVAGVPAAEREQLVSKAFFIVISASIVGNFFAAWVATKVGYRRSIAVMCLGFFVSILGGYGVTRSHTELLGWIPLVGFFSGVFGLFTMYLPPLFPTLLRTTGAGFCYNIGRIFAAAGTIIFGQLAIIGDFRTALLYNGFLFIPAVVVAFFLPEPKSLHED
ncbi:MAG: MFS transporter [Verrucomicrobiota bacterium]|nr:MFS transporter [Verrucomicrobiota bacterium]